VRCTCSGQRMRGDGEETVNGGGRACKRRQGVEGGRSIKTKKRKNLQRKGEGFET
jgi:hypothetical protein